eukprot:8642513-Pyramimonas_sp.AAC.1
MRWGAIPFCIGHVGPPCAPRASRGPRNHMGAALRKNGGILPAQTAAKRHMSTSASQPSKP